MFGINFLARRESEAPSPLTTAVKVAMLACVVMAPSGNSQECPEQQPCEAGLTQQACPETTDSAQDSPQPVFAATTHPTNHFPIIQHSTPVWCEVHPCGTVAVTGLAPRGPPAVFGA